MHKRKFTAGFLMVAAVALAGSMSSTAAGAYTYALPVSACTSSAGSPIYPWQGIYNNSTTSIMNLDCNAATVPESGGSVDAVAVNVDDQSSSSILCHMRLLNFSGDILHTAAQWSSSGTGEATKTWDDLATFGAPNSYVYCTIPVKSGSSTSGVQSLWTQAT